MCLSELFYWQNLFHFMPICNPSQYFFNQTLDPSVLSWSLFLLSFWKNKSDGKYFLKFHIDGSILCIAHFNGLASIGSPFPLFFFTPMLLLHFSIHAAFSPFSHHFLCPSHPSRRYEIHPVCADLQGQILTCYKENVGKTLNCSNIAALYLQCVNNAKQVGSDRNQMYICIHSSY